MNYLTRNLIVGTILAITTITLLSFVDYGGRWMTTGFALTNAMVLGATVGVISASSSKEEI